MFVGYAQAVPAEQPSSFSCFLERSVVSSARQLLGTQAEVHLAVNADTEVQLREGDKLMVLALE
jgi:hypothetical protein